MYEKIYYTTPLHNFENELKTLKNKLKMSKFGDYVKSSYDELVHKVSWPTFKELQNSAVVVAVAAVILAVIIFLMDYIFGVQGGVWKGILGIYYSIIG